MRGGEGDGWDGWVVGSGVAGFYSNDTGLCSNERKEGGNVKEL